MKKQLVWGMMVVVVGLSGAVVACDAAVGGGAPVAVSFAELTGVVAEGPTRVEVTLAAGGAVAELVASVEVGHDEHIEGSLGVLDAQARQLELEDIGAVAWGEGARFRTLEDSRVSEAEWIAAVGAARASGAAVRVRADRPQQLSVAGPEEAAFVATELRLERGDGPAKLELVITAAHLDAAAGVLTVLGRGHDVSEARLFDDRGASGAEAGDDNGGGAAGEAGDDNGGGGGDA